jgi:hypothetical protein
MSSAVDSCSKIGSTTSFGLVLRRQEARERRSRKQRAIPGPVAGRIQTSHALHCISTSIASSHVFPGLTAIFCKTSMERQRGLSPYSSSPRKAPIVETPALHSTTFCIILRWIRRASFLCTRTSSSTSNSSSKSAGRGG